MNNSYKGIPAPHVYDSGTIYQDQGIQPHIALMANFFDQEAMDATGTLYAASPLLLSALIKAVEDADQSIKDQLAFCNEMPVEYPDWYAEAKSAIEAALNLKTVQK